MKKYNKYLGLFLLSLATISCDNEDVYKTITEPAKPDVTLNANGLDFSNYISVGASFSAGFTDGALFKAGQENSFPNILASKFAMANGGDFTQPLMNDNIGGMIKPDGEVFQEPRFIFSVTAGAPVRLDASPTTVVGAPAENAPNFSNYGIPGAKSTHFLAPNYGAASGLATNPPTANPYFVRMAPTQPTVLEEVVSKQPTFFTLSEIGGNDVLGYALSGGDNTSPMTPTETFNQVIGAMVNTLTGNKTTKGVIGTVPYITSLANFTTVPHNPLDPTTNEELAGSIPTLNMVYGAINQIFTALGETNRIVEFSKTEANPVVIIDENLPDLSAQITGGLLANKPAFEAFIKGFGLPATYADAVAGLLGTYYGQARPATKNDLLLLASSAVIGKVDGEAMQVLMKAGLPQELAGQFSIQGVSSPLSDKWVLTPEEQKEIKDTVDAYNTTIKNLAQNNENLALVDLNAILESASTSGVEFDDYNLTTNLVTGGLISLDGVHLTGRGYALMANEMLKAIDAKFGSNFSEATDGLAKADDYPTNYSPTLK